MITSQQFISNLKLYINTQLEVLSKDNPIISFISPIITRVVNNNIHKLGNGLNLISDSQGNIDIENIIQEMINNILESNPFNYNIPYIGNVELGGGSIKLNIPFTSKKLILNSSDLETMKEILISKT